MLRPRPLPGPASFVVKNGSNARSRTSGDMPTPVSLTSTTELPSAMRVLGQFVFGLLVFLPSLPAADWRLSADDWFWLMVLAVVCTLWEAADFVALLVMDGFYTALHAGSPPASALRDAQVALRDMTGRDLLATLDRWRAVHPAFIAALGALPEVPPDALDAAIYADPFYWAPFMLIGKPD